MSEFFPIDTASLQPRSLHAEASPHAAVLAEMEKLQKNQVGWSGFALWLIVSLVMFAAAGLWQQKLQGLLVLVGVIFVHEMGHYIAMRAFGYRNLRMFFIPGFGAAVSGRHYNVAGWKKVIVSLAGPVPGIFAGIALGVAALVTDHRELMPLALMAIGLNGFNLLPLLPLDGGWVLHATLFCRHPVLDTGFKLIAAVLLIAAGLAGLGWFAGIWGGIMLIGLPLQYRLANLAAKLRREGVATASSEVDSVPLATAERILDELQPMLPPTTQPKVVAQNALHIFETLNARPPHWAVTILLLMIHAGSFFAAVIGMFILVLATRPGGN